MLDEKDKATDAVEDALDEARAEAEQEGEAKGRLDARLDALEARVNAAPAPELPDIDGKIAAALAPITERLEALISQGQPSSEPEPEPEPEPDPFASQIDLQQIGKTVTEHMPKVSHPLFRRFGR